MDGSSPCNPENKTTNDLSRLHLLDAAASFVGLWPLIMSYFNETGPNDEGNSLAVRRLPPSVELKNIWSQVYWVSGLQEEEMDGYFHLNKLTHLRFRLFHTLFEICKFVTIF